ncbi:MAG: hypothetical protein HY682_11180 [Chloroflexi bacterium]|nr:hypothetical protein [Chloroflexota bacterium]
MLPNRTRANQQIVLQNEHGRALFSPAAGASLRSLVVRSSRGPCELLLGGEGPHRPDELPRGTGSFIMAPWPNRIRNGRIAVDGRAYSVPITSGIHAVHGTVRRRPFEIVHHTRNSARFATSLGSDWPFPGSVIYEATLDGPSLLQRLEIHSQSQRFPAGFGWHPWFKRRIGDGDAAIRAEVDAVWVVDQDMTPTGQTVAPCGPTALNAGIVPSSGSLDHCFRLASDPGPVVLQWPAVALRIESSTAMTHLQVYTPDGALCVEPQTCCVDAFRLASAGVPGTGVAYVEPGAPLTGWTRWTWS